VEHPVAARAAWRDAAVRLKHVAHKVPCLLLPDEFAPRPLLEPFLHLLAADGVAARSKRADHPKAEHGCSSVLLEHFLWTVLLLFTFSTGQAGREI